MTPQIAPIDRHARYRKSSDAAWPIRLADGRTPAQAKADAADAIKQKEQCYD